MVARDGPLSAYGVRRLFVQSQTPSWSSSAGSIYPVIRRLQERGLVHSADADGGRKRRDLSVTHEGRGLVREWLLKVDQSLGAATPDPLRTRTHFLALLEGDEQIRFLDEALRCTEQALEVSRTICTELSATNQLKWLAELGVLYQLEAKRRWLRDVRRALLKKA